MGASTRNDLSSRLDAVVAEARDRAKAFQSEADAAHRGVQERFQKFLPIAERITAIAREKLERLRERLTFQVTPASTQAERFYTRSVTIDVKSDLAGVIKLSFRLGHDRDVTNIMLDYELVIVPVFFKYTPHVHLDIPLDAYNEAAVSQWLDDRIVDFANAYLELHLTKQHQERILVSDVVAGISFPKCFAASTLDHDGTTYYFVSDETRREFERQHGLTR